MSLAGQEGAEQSRKWRRSDDSFNVDGRSNCTTVKNSAAVYEVDDFHFFPV